VAESGIPLKTPIVRIGLPDAPAPAARTLETGYYTTADTVLARLRDITSGVVFEGESLRVVSGSIR
jgi:hypothetical protein